MIIGTGRTAKAPTFVGPFSQAEASFMRNVSLLAEAGFNANDVLDEQSRYALASIILYLSSCERQSRPLDRCDPEAMATEALDVLLSMPCQKPSIRQAAG